MSQLITYKYNDQEIEFEVSPETLMVNATEMAKIFNKKVEDFTRLQNTKDFISALLKNANQRFISEEKNGISRFILNRKSENSRFIEEDLITSTQKSGTWMHRVLALKFAAWLNAEFEVWVFSTIDQIIFGQYYELRDQLAASAMRKNRIGQLEQKLSDNKDFQELEALKKKERSSAYKRGQVISKQRELFEQQL